MICALQVIKPARSLDYNFLHSRGQAELLLKHAIIPNIVVYSDFAF